MKHAPSFSLLTSGLTSAIALALLLSSPATAQERSSDKSENTVTSPASEQTARIQKRATESIAVFNGTRKAEEVFDDSFLNIVPAKQLAELSAQLIAEHGAMKSVESVKLGGPYSASMTYRFERALGDAEIALTPGEPHKISSLLIKSITPISPGDENMSGIERLGKIRAELEGLPGEVGVLFAPLHGKPNPILAINQDQQFALGSTFKLYILSALSRSIANGERKWSDTITLTQKSFPSGVLQNWPDGAPLTLQTAASLMISISDNTATDLLLHELGRDAVEAEMLRIGHSDPAKNKPFLSTLEIFALKGSPDNMAKYIAADEAGKRRILDDFADDLASGKAKPIPPTFTAPTEIDTLEWFASGRDLQKLALSLAENKDPVVQKILTINKAVPERVHNKWNYIGYKGGSEPGVLNFTWILQDKTGQWKVLAMSWNNTKAVVDERKFHALAIRLLEAAS